MITNLQQREVFHILFLRHLASRLKAGTYAVKGGVNLRLFFGSPRYSEDMDIDIKGVETFRLKDIAMDIISSSPLLATARTFNIEKVIPPNIAKAKQTETTQRFKIHLINSASENLFTKIEFSRRGLTQPLTIESIDEAILKQYKLPPVIISHYPAQTAVLQKVRALADRTSPQARDIFDIYMLLPRITEAKQALKTIPKDIAKKATARILDLDFVVFRNTVLNYLNDDDRSAYDCKEAWEVIQSKTSAVIEGLL